MNKQAVEILGVRVFEIDQRDLIEQVLAWVRQGERRTLTYANAHCLNLAVEDASYRELLNRTDLVYVDGIGAVWAGRLLGFRGLRKVTGRNWIAELCRRGEEEKLRIYLLGGRPGVAEQASLVLGQRYPRLQLCGAADGFFQAKPEAKVLAEIKAQIPTEICWSAGALFDYLAGWEKPVPKWLERIGLEWAWRLKEDPKGKWRRYALGIPRFVGRVIGQWLKRR
jgi:N-acetylglucosaminyldiphosphoundecaprenol N-acetyl-beta-D-mannosaminyltransferase